MCNFHALSESFHRPLYPFWNNQPKSLFVKTSFRVSKHCCFHFSCIFHIFYIGKLHYCQEGTHVPICACACQEGMHVPICACTGVCKWVAAWGWHQESVSVTLQILDWSRVLLMNLEFANTGESRWPVCSRYPLSTFPVLELQACHQTYLAFIQVLETWTLALRLTRQVL